MFNKKIWLAPAIVAGVALMAGALWMATSFDKAQAGNAHNTGIMRDDVVQINEANSSAWTNIMSGDIYTSNAEDAVYDVSMECSLYTETLVRSKGGISDTSKAEAMVEVRVMVDGVEAKPGVVKFCSRAQTLMATFNGICSDLNGDGVVNYNECGTEEEVKLILDTTNANAFNFFSLNLAVGPHHIDVETRLTTDTEYVSGAAQAGALVGKATVALQEVKWVKSTELP